MSHVHFLRIKGLSPKSTRSANRDLVMPRVMAHNLREIVAEYGVSEGSHIDPTKTKHNIILRGSHSSGAVSMGVQELMQDVRVSKWRKDTISAIELIFSLPSDSHIAHQAYFSDAVTWAECFFQVPIISAVIHLDEDAPHCHTILIPIVDGKLCGSKVMGDNKRINTMHDDFFGQVGKRYGIARPCPPKRYSEAIRREAIELAFNVLEANSGLQSDIVRGIVELSFNNPQPLLQLLSLDMPKPKIKGTFAGIMTKPVKADKPEAPRQTPKAKPIEVQKVNPIEVHQRNSATKSQPLSCVEVRFSEPELSSDAPPIQDDFKRESDNEHLASTFDEVTGEFIKQVIKESKKKIIENEVDNLLQELASKTAKV